MAQAVCSNTTRPRPLAAPLSAASAVLNIQQQQPFYGTLSGTTRVSQYSPTLHPDHHPIFISFFHLPWSIASSLFELRAWQKWQSFCATSLHVLFGLPLGLEPSTSYSIHYHANYHSIIQWLFKNHADKHLNSGTQRSDTCRYWHCPDITFRFVRTLPQILATIL